MEFSEKNLIDFEKCYCKRSLSNFTKRAWSILDPGTPYVHNWHIDAISDCLKAIANSDITRLVINIPPGMTKSLMTAVMFPAWLWGPFEAPHKRIISASHSAAIATRDNRKTRNLITADWFTKLWPVELTSDQNEKTYFENSATGWRQSCAVGSMTGRRGDVVIWDDPHSIEGSHSKVLIEKAGRVFTETLPTRLIDVKKSSIIIIMQRVNVNDVSAFALDMGYEHLCLPMQFEPQRKCIMQSIGFEDPRKEDGELLFPERFPQDYVDKFKKASAFAHACQNQQNPIPLGGNIIKSSMFGFYKVLPPIKYRIITGDTAMKDKEANDYSVLQCWGVGKDNYLYLIDQIRGKWLSPELKLNTLAFWNKNKSEDTKKLGTLRAIYIEDKSSGTGLIQEIKAMHKIPIFGIKVDKDRYTRVQDVLGYIESGQVWLPANAPFLSDFLIECEAYNADDSHPHDDQIDPMCYAIEKTISVASIPAWARS